MSDVQQEAVVETEAQKRRRLRQERILNRGNARLNRIRHAFNEVQEESSDTGGEIGMVGGHDIRMSPSPSVPSIAPTPDTEESGEHAAGVTLESIGRGSGSSTSIKPKRRAGNLARKARSEAGAEKESPFLGGNRGSRSSTLTTEDINSSALDDLVTDPLADPAADTSTGEGIAISGTAADVDGGDRSTIMAAATGGRRVFSVMGLSRSVIRLVPVVSVFAYGLIGEHQYESLVGDSKEDVYMKWSSLLATRPDNRLDGWSNGNFLMWYLMLIELAFYSAYLVLGDNRNSSSRQPQITPLAALLPIPGAHVPSWIPGILSLFNRTADSLSLLLFLTAFAIVFA